MRTAILLCAGKSTRFPGYRPKWSLTHPNGNMMAAEALRGLSGCERVVAAFNDDDWLRFGGEKVLNEFTEAGLVVDVVCVGNTASPVETVQRALELGMVDGPFVARDCDSAFEWEPPALNAVAVADLMAVGSVDASNKSYIKPDPADPNGNRVWYIEERELLSRYFCCGAYAFESRAMFERYAKGRTFLSQVIGAAIVDFRDFRFSVARGYVDWGTASAWSAYTREFKTLFVDVDGVLAESSHRSFDPRWGTGKLFEKNIAYLNALHDSGKVELVLVTSRPEAAREATERQLASLQYDRLLMGFRACARYIVNDYAPQRGEATCFAVGLERDTDMLEQALKRVSAS